MKNFNNYLFSSHAVGRLMSNGRSKTGISKTTESYLKLKHSEILFNKKKDISSKYLDKGIKQENESIKLLSEVLNLDLEKNEIRKENGFLTGEPDIVLANKIIDIKTSWDFSTFPLYENEILNKDYYWQLQSYMELFDKDFAELVYCLVDTPFTLIEDEKRRTSWKLGFLELPEKLESAIENNLLYDHLPKEIRVKRFKIERNKEDIEKMYSKIEVCRNYMNELSEIVNENIIHNL